MPLNELERLAAVNRFLDLEVDRNAELEDIVKMAAEICHTPVALITLLDDETQFIKFQTGFDCERTDKKDAFCQYAIQAYDILEVPDANQDPRFVNNPLVTGDPNIRFYAGAPLTTRDGHNLGSLCVIDQQPRQLTDQQRRMLSALSRQAMKILEFEMSIKVLGQQVATIKQSEVKLRSFFESSVSCHLLLGINFEVMAFNKPVQQIIHRLFGAKLREGADIREYVHKSHLEEFVSSCTAALQGQTIVSEQELVYPDRAVYWYFVYEPAMTPDGTIIGVSYNATDITDRIKQERLIFAQNESLRKIAFMQSHELRRPVSSILGLMNLRRKLLPVRPSGTVDAGDGSQRA